MTSRLPTAVWVGGYLLLVLAPLLALLLGPMPSGSGFWWDFSMALGFTAMAMMGVQFLLTARFPFANIGFGIDILYYFHRYLALMALAFIALHVLIISVRHPGAIGSLNPLDAPGHMTAGLAAFGLFVLLIATALWRKPLRLAYEQWRLLHIGMAAAALLLALVHIEGVGYYINAPLKHGLWHGYSLLWLLLVIYVRLIKPWQMRRKPYRVSAIEPERGDSWTMTLKPDGHPGLHFHPGQFAWLTLRASPWHIKEHPFSFSSSARLRGEVTFTIKALGDFTRTIKDTKIGERAYLDGPYGAFTIDRHPEAAGFVFIAGGVGVAPIISMLRTMADRGDRRPVSLFYGNKTWDDVIFREELELLKDRLNLRLIHILTDPPPGWTGESGIITPDILKRRLPADGQDYIYFLCGPKSMSATVQQELADLRVPARRIHFELFDMV